MVEITQVFEFLVNNLVSISVTLAVIFFLAKLVKTRPRKGKTGRRRKSWLTWIAEKLPWISGFLAVLYIIYMIGGQLSVGLPNAFMPQEVPQTIETLMLVGAGLSIFVIGADIIATGSFERGEAYAVSVTNVIALFHYTWVHNTDQVGSAFTYTIVLIALILVLSLLSFVSRKTR